jgi:serine/threonine protein kinase
MSNGQAKLIDFGIARHFLPQSNATMIGTQGYAPPEQYRGKAETRSDLYALGATMHHAISGRDPTTEPPFSFPPLRQAAPGVAPALAELVDQALTYDLVQRIPNAAEFKRRLTAIKAGGIASARAAAPILLSPEAQPGASPASTSAPTILSTPSEIRCPGCSRYVPADSKFCSFCATDVRWVLGSSEIAGRHEAETAGLSEPPSPFAGHHGDHVHHGRPHRRRRFAFRAVTVMALFFGAYLGMKFLSSLASNQDTEPPEGSIAPEPYPYPGAPYPGAPAPAPYPGAPAPAPEAGEPPHTTMREATLRRWLNQMGYSSVHFRVDGDTVQLWGTVRTPWDRMVVQQLTSGVTGFLSIEDHLKVQQDEYGYEEP